MAKLKLARIVYKELKEGIPGGPSKGQKVKSHAIYGGKRYELNDLVEVQRRGEKNKPIKGFVPRVVEEKRLAELEARPTVSRQNKTTLSSKDKAKNKYIRDTLEGMSDKELFRLTQDDMWRLFNRQDVSHTRKSVLAKRIDPATGEYYKPYDMPFSAWGRRYKEYDKFDNPIPAVKMKLEKDLGLKNKSNYDKIIKLFDEIDAVPENKSGSKAKSSLMLQVNRAIKNGLSYGIPEDAVVEHVVRQVDASAWGKLLGQRNKRWDNITRAELAGILKKGDRPELSHIIPASQDWTKAMRHDNIFYEPKKINRARPHKEIAERKDGYLEELDKRMEKGFKYHDPLIDRYSLAKGGLIKDILGGTAKMSRRKFLKGSGAMAASTALPMRTVAKILPKVAEEAATRMAPPWIKSMVGVLDQLGTKGGYMSHTMKNGTKIETRGGIGETYSGTTTPFTITASDGYKVPVNVNKNKKGDIHIEFDIRDDFNNNQHIYMDKKTGTVEIVDENYYMTGPEDYAKDDPLVWDVTTPTQMSQFEKKMGLMRGDGDDYIKDYMSTPEGGDYSDLFESFIDSFSPSGNIFHTKAKSQAAKLKELQKKETSELDWESQFRGGNLHSYKSGGSVASTDRYSLRENILNAIAQQETGGLPENKRDTYKSASGHRGRYGLSSQFGIAMDGAPTRSSVGYRVPAWNDFNTTWQDPKKQRQYAGDYVMGMYDYYTKNPNKMKYGNYANPHDDRDRALYETLIRYGPTQVEDDKTVRELGHPKNYYDMVMQYYNNGGIARRPGAVPPEKGPNPLGISIKDMGEKFIKKMAKGGAARKIPKVMGNLSNYKAKIEGPPTIGPMKPDRPYTVFDEDGLPLKAARDFVRNDEYADMYTVGTRKSQVVDDAPGAMFWNSREKIINAPSEAMQANQWLDFMKRGKHGILNPKGLPIIKDQELNDTSLAPFLSQMGKQIISKEKLVKEFDEMAPTFDVIALGDSSGTKILGKIEKNLNKIDSQAIRNPQVKGFFDYMKSVIAPLKSGDKKEKDFIAGKINEMVERNFGIKNSLDDGVPQRFPFEIKEILQQVSTALGKRTSGFSKYDSRAIHEGTQTLSGGDNYREFLFTHRPGKLRRGEPNYTYAHEFGLGSGERSGGVVHTRVSDRTDQFGRRLMHIEEIQSDMHQKINMAQRALKKMHTNWEKQGLTIQQGINRLDGYAKKDYLNMVKDSKYAPRQDVRLKKALNANEQQMRLIQSKIEDLLTKPQNKATQIRLVRLNKERAKIRKILEDEKNKIAESTDTTNIPEGPLRKSEDYNEFVMKYLLRVAQEGGYDGLSISTPAIKNLSLTPGSRDFIGNLTAYGPIANGAMKKAAKKIGAKFMKTAIVDEKKRGWEIPMILLKENKIAQELIKKGTPIYKKGGSVRGKK